MDNKRGSQRKMQPTGACFYSLGRADSGNCPGPLFTSPRFSGAIHFCELPRQSALSDFASRSQRTSTFYLHKRITGFRFDVLHAELTYSCKSDFRTGPPPQLLRNADSREVRSSGQKQHVRSLEICGHVTWYFCGSDHVLSGPSGVAMSAHSGSSVMHRQAL